RSEHAALQMREGAFELGAEHPRSGLPIEPDLAAAEHAGRAEYRRVEPGVDVEEFVVRPTAAGMNASVEPAPVVSRTRRCKLRRNGRPQVRGRRMACERRDDDGKRKRQSFHGCPPCQDPMTPRSPPRRLRVNKWRPAPALVRTQEMPRLWLHGYMGPLRHRRHGEESDVAAHQRARSRCPREPTRKSEHPTIMFGLTGSPRAPSFETL